MFGFDLAVLLGVVALRVGAATPDQWRSQSIYQVLTDRYSQTDGSTNESCDVNVYCGGTWKGIQKNLDYIQGMGFTAIWISPVTLNLQGSTPDGESYHGYWQQDIFSVNSKFGTSQDLKDLSDALHGKGMYLMVDIVTNHMGYNGDADTVDYSVFNPFNDQSYYHAPCDEEGGNQTSQEVCWEVTTGVSLPDLRTEDSDVSSVQNDWVKDLISNYSIDGIRLDSASHVNPTSLSSFQDAAGIFITGEVFNGDQTYTCPYQNDLDSVLNYPIYFPLIRAFNTTDGSMSDLANMIQSVKSDCKDSTVLGSFAENQDNPRFPSWQPDLTLAKNLITYTILADGVPIIYYGQEQHFNGGATPQNREALWPTDYNTSAPLYQLIKTVNGVRAQAISNDPKYLTYGNYPVYTDDHTIAMRKGFDGGQVIAVLSNVGSDGSDYTVQLSTNMTGFTANEKVVDMISGNSLTTDSSGGLSAQISGGMPMAFFPASAAGSNSTSD